MLIECLAADVEDAHIVAILQSADPDALLRLLHLHLTVLQVLGDHGQTRRLVQLCRQQGDDTLVVLPCQVADNGIQDVVFIVIKGFQHAVVIDSGTDLHVLLFLQAVNGQLHVCPALVAGHDEVRCLQQYLCRAADGHVVRMAGVESHVYRLIVVQPVIVNQQQAYLVPGAADAMAQQLTMHVGDARCILGDGLLYFLGDGLRGTATAAHLLHGPRVGEDGRHVVGTQHAVEVLRHLIVDGDGLRGEGVDEDVLRSVQVVVLRVEMLVVDVAVQMGDGCGARVADGQVDRHLLIDVDGIARRADGVLEVLVEVRLVLHQPRPAFAAATEVGQRIEHLHLRVVKVNVIT